MMMMMIIIIYYLYFILLLVYNVPKKSNIVFSRFLKSKSVIQITTDMVEKILAFGKTKMS